jgi:methionine-rich copper-binding protein CopC
MHPTEKIIEIMEKLSAERAAVLCAVAADMLAAQQAEGEAHPAVNRKPPLNQDVSFTSPEEMLAYFKS